MISKFSPDEANVDTNEGQTNEAWVKYLNNSNIIFYGNLSYTEAYEPSYDAKEGRYEGYRDQNLPEGYTAYGENGNADPVYDRYDPDYVKLEARPKQNCCKRLRSCCSDMGRLI